MPRNRIFEQRIYRYQSCGNLYCTLPTELLWAPESKKHGLAAADFKTYVIKLAVLIALTDFTVSNFCWRRSLDSDVNRFFFAFVFLKKTCFFCKKNMA